MKGIYNAYGKIHYIHGSTNDEFWELYSMLNKAENYNKTSRYSGDYSVISYTDKTTGEKNFEVWLNDDLGVPHSIEWNFEEGGMKRV